MDTSWTIEEVNPDNESVHLIKSGTGIRRMFSVPGASHAWMDGNFLYIISNTGYVWKVTPENGHRRRFFNQESDPIKANDPLAQPA